MGKSNVASKKRLRGSDDSESDTSSDGEAFFAKFKRARFDSDSDSETDSETMTGPLFGLKLNQSSFKIESDEFDREKNPVPAEDGRWPESKKQRVKDDRARFGPEWHNAVERRQAVLEANPDYQFMIKVAGAANTEVEKLFDEESIAERERQFTRQRLREQALLEARTQRGELQSVKKNIDVQRGEIADNIDFAKYFLGNGAAIKLESLQRRFVKDYLEIRTKRELLESLIKAGAGSDNIEGAGVPDDATEARVEKLRNALQTTFTQKRRFDARAFWPEGPSQVSPGNQAATVLRILIADANISNDQLKASFEIVLTDEQKRALGEISIEDSSKFRGVVNAVVAWLASKKRDPDATNRIASLRRLAIFTQLRGVFAFMRASRNQNQSGRNPTYELSPDEFVATFDTGNFRVQDAIDRFGEILNAANLPGLAELNWLKFIQLHYRAQELYAISKVVLNGRRFNSLLNQQPALMPQFSSDKLEASGDNRQPNLIDDSDDVLSRYFAEQDDEEQSMLTDDMRKLVARRDNFLTDQAELPELLSVAGWPDAANDVATRWRKFLDGYEEKWGGTAFWDTIVPPAPGREDGDEGGVDDDDEDEEDLTEAQIAARTARAKPKPWGYSPTRKPQDLTAETRRVLNQFYKLRWADKVARLVAGARLSREEIKVLRTMLGLPLQSRTKLTSQALQESFNFEAVASDFVLFIMSAYHTLLVLHVDQQSKTLNELESTRAALVKRQEAAVAGKPQLVEVAELPYEHRALYATQAFATGHVRLKPIVVWAIGQAWTLVRSYTPFGQFDGVDVEFMQHDETVSGDFATIVASKMAGAKMRFPQQYLQLGLKELNREEEMSAMARFKSRYRVSRVRGELVVQILPSGQGTTYGSLFWR